MTTFSWLVVYTCHPVLVVWDANYHDQHIFVPALFIITLMLRVHDLCILSLQPSFRQPGNMLRVPKLNDVTDTCQFLLDYIFTYICIKSYSFILLFEVYKVYGITHFRGILWLALVLALRWLLVKIHNLCFCEWKAKYSCNNMHWKIRKIILKFLIE